MLGLVGALAVLLGSAFAGNNTVAFIEDYFYEVPGPVAQRIATTVMQHGGVAFQVLSMITWVGDFSPNETVPLPPANATVVAFLKGLANAGPAPIRVWGGVSLCPGPAYSCMLNETQANITGQQLAGQIIAAGLDGVMIYVQPYCNNKDCHKTTGKYAEGTANILASFRANAPHHEIALLANEWENMELLVRGDPVVVFSWQTVFYPESEPVLSSCQQQCGRLCGAGESVYYVTRSGLNFTSVMKFLDGHNVTWLAQLGGASDEASLDPPDFWTALEWFSSA